MAAKDAPTIKAGSFVGYDPDNFKLAAVVIETSKNSYDDGTTEEFALIAKLPVELVNMDAIFPYGSDPTEKPREVSESTKDTADSIGG